MSFPLGGNLLIDIFCEKILLFQALKALEQLSKAPKFVKRCKSFPNKNKYQEDLLLNVCRDNDLSYEDLHTKYVKPFKKNMKKTKGSNSNLIDNSDSDSDDEEEDIKSTVNVQSTINDSNVLEKKLINDILCYVENKEGGAIYNNEVCKIGEVKQGEFFLYN